MAVSSKTTSKLKPLGLKSVADLYAVPRGDDAATALVETARLCVTVGATALAIELVTRAVAVDERATHLKALRAELLERFAVLHAGPSFRKPFRGWPARGGSR